MPPPDLPQNPIPGFPGQVTLGRRGCPLWFYTRQDESKRDQPPLVVSSQGTSGLWHTLHGPR